MSFYGEKDDYQLLNLKDYLISLKEVDDVRYKLK